MTRFCLLITGQIRSAQEPLARLQEIVAGREVTVVASVWDQIGRKMEGALNASQIRRMFEPNAYMAVPLAWYGHRHLWPALPALKRHLLGVAGASHASQIEALLKEYFPAAIVDIEPTQLLDLQFDRELEDSNSMRMTYKFWRANQIKRRLEREQGRFDVVIRTRPDLLIQDLDLDRLAAKIAEGKVLIDGWAPENRHASDNFVASSSAAMDAYCALFARTIMEPPAWVHVHRTLVDHLEACGLEVENYFIKPRIVREEQGITVEQITAALAEMQATGEAWTATHAATLRACRAIAARHEGGPEAALAELRALEPALDRAELLRADGYFLVLCAELMQAGEPDAAAACALAAAPWRSPPNDPRRQAALDAILASVGRRLPAGAPAEPENLAQILIATLQGPSLPEDHWLWPLLRHLAAPAAPEAWLRARMAGFLEQPDARAAMLKLLTAGRHWAVLAAFVNAFEKSIPADAMAGTVRDDAVATMAAVGTAYQQLGQLDRAAACFERAVQLRPANHHLKYQLAEVLKRMARPAEARHWQALALQANPTHAGATRQMVELCLLTGDPTAAVGHARDLAKLQESEPVRLLLAFALFESGESEAGLAEARRVPPGTRLPGTLVKLPGHAPFMAAFLAAHARTP